MAKVSVSNDPDARTFVQNFVFNGNYFGRVQYNGYLKVPEDGIYTLYFRPDHDGYLKIDGRMISNYSGYIRTMVPRVYKLTLKEGMHSLEFDYQIKRADFGRWYVMAEFEWEGPAFERQPSCQAELYHSPESLSQLAGEVRPLQERTY